MNKECEVCLNLFVTKILRSGVRCVNKRFNRRKNLNTIYRIKYSCVFACLCD